MQWLRLVKLFFYLFLSQSHFEMLILLCKAASCLRLSLFLTLPYLKSITLNCSRCFLLSLTYLLSIPKPLYLLNGEQKLFQELNVVICLRQQLLLIKLNPFHIMNKFIQASYFYLLNHSLLFCIKLVNHRLLLLIEHA